MNMTDPFNVPNPKPCPFCGDNLVTVYQGDTYRWRVAVCDSCGAQAPDVRHSIGEGQTREQAYAYSNKRATEAWNERSKGIEESIRSDERERIKAANAPEIERINAYIKSLEDAVRDEREACAKLADKYMERWTGDAIRARGNT